MPDVGMGYRSKGMSPYRRFFVENPLVLCCGDAAPRTNADLDSTSVSNRRRVGGLHRYHGNFLALQHTLLNVQGWRRHDIPIGFHISQLHEQSVRDRVDLR